MASAETAATVLTNCFRSDDFSAASLQTYDKKIEQRFGQSFQTSRMMQRLANKAWLLNFVIGKVSRNEELRHLFTAMYTNESIREKLRKPSFYAGLLLK
jgi:flavin-dependent dehydrogenase